MSNMSEMATILDGVWSELDDWMPITFEIEGGRIVGATVGHQTLDAPEGLYYLAEGDKYTVDPDGEWRDWCIVTHEPCEFLTEDYVLRLVSEQAEGIDHGYVQWTTETINDYNGSEEMSGWAVCMMAAEIPED